MNLVHFRLWHFSDLTLPLMKEDRKQVARDQTDAFDP